jgi:hypothetical protein
MENSVSTIPVGQCRIMGRYGLRVESDMRTRLNLCHSNGCIHYLTHEGAGECAHGGFGRAVHATAHVRFPSCNRPNVDDMACVANFEVCRNFSAMLQETVKCAFWGWGGYRKVR